MNSTHAHNKHTQSQASLSAEGILLRKLRHAAREAACKQVDAFAARLSGVLMELSETSTDSKLANASFTAANLLKTNAYAYHHLAGELLEKGLKRECEQLEHPFSFDKSSQPQELSLVPMEEMEDQVLLSTLSRPFDNEHAAVLAAITMRLGCLLNTFELPAAQNPFRPAVFISALHRAWCEFDPNEETHPLVLPLLKTEVFIDLAPVLKEVNELLIKHGVAPGGSDGYRIKKTTGGASAQARQQAEDAELSQQLQRYFSRAPAAPTGVLLPAGALAAPALPAAPHALAGSKAGAIPAAAAPGTTASGAVPPGAFVVPGQGDNARLFNFLNGIQGRMSAAQASAAPPNVTFLPNIKKHAPPGSLSQMDESTIDLLSNVFDSVFKDQVIQEEAKELIGFLQMPILKVALLDKDFFFKNEHPARRLVDLLGRLSLECAAGKGKDDPLFQAMKRNVDRVQKEFDREIAVFSEVVAELEQRASEVEQEAVKQLDAPISDALHQEKIGQATRAAKTEVETRINTGEVAEFVESFLVARWVPVLTIAYSMREEKPQTLESAIKTMDDLIWSVKPKSTMAERKELIARLPAMLATLNRWLDVLKWEDAERLQFFADLAECHASIVRAPLDLTPQRQLEIAAESARLAAERRQQKLAAKPPEPEPDEFVHTVDSLKSGMWMEFAQADGGVKKVKLAWVSPLRTLFIFSDGSRKESFSMPSEELAQLFRDDKVRVVAVDGMLNRALARAMQTAAINDPEMAPQAAA